MIPSFDCFLPVTPTENLAGQLADNRFSSDTGNMGDARGRRQKDAERQLGNRLGQRIRELWWGWALLH